VNVELLICVDVVARRQMKTRINNSSNIAQSHVIEHQLRDNPIYARTATHQPSTTGHLDNCNSLHHHLQRHPHHHASTSAAAAGHSYEKLDHVIINPTTSVTNPACNLLTVTTPTGAAVTSSDVVNTMGYLVATPTSRDQLARPVIILAPRSRAADNMVEQLNVVTDHQHGRQCCCNSTSGLPSTATSGGGYMECDTRTRNHVIGGAESHDRQHVTGRAESRETGGRHDGWLPRDQNANHRCSKNAAGPYTSMTHQHNRLNDWNISAL